MEIGVAGPILTQKKTSKDIWGNDIRNLQYGWKNVAIIHIYGAKAIFYYFVITKTPNPSHKK